MLALGVGVLGHAAQYSTSWNMVRIEVVKASVTEALEAA